MPSEEDYGSDYDAIPEAGRTKQHLISDESDDELPSSGPKRPLPCLNDDGDDDDDDMPMIVEETKQERSASASTSTSNSVAVNPIRQPTAFAAPTPNPAITSGGPTFYRTPVHASISAEGTSISCVEGYVNTPELSAGRGGGLSQGLPANGPYKSLFRAKSESRGGNKATATTAAATAAIAPDAALHVLAEAAQSPEALSPVSTASPAPVPTAKKRRKPSSLAPSSPASSVTQLESISISAATQPSPAASASAGSSHVMDRSPPRRRQQLSQAKLRDGGTGKGKYQEKPLAAATTPRPPSTQVVSGNDGKRYERQPVPHQQPVPSFTAAQPREADFAVQARPRNVQKKRAGLEEEAASLPSPPAPAPTPADDGSYEHVRDYYPSYYEAELPDASNTVAHTVSDGGQSPSPPPANTWESPGPSPSVINHYPASARTNSKEPSPELKAESRSVMPGTKPRMLTLLIEDRRHGTDDLAEVHVPLKTAGEGQLWADAQDVCAALQSGPSRIDGPAKVSTMRGKYRQIFLRISADGEETTRSANLKVEMDRTLLIVVEGIVDPRVVMPATLSPNPSPLVRTGPAAPWSNTAHPLTPAATYIDLDGDHPTPPRSHKEVGGTRKRKRETSLSNRQQSPFGSLRSRNYTKGAIEASAAARTIPTSHEHYTHSLKSKRSDATSSFESGYASDSHPGTHHGQRAQRKDQVASSRSRLHLSGYETDQPLPSMRRSSGVMSPQEQHQGSDRRVSTLLQPPPAPREGSQRTHDKVVSFLRDNFTEDASHWNEFTRDRAHVGSLSNAALLRVYWFAQKRLDAWVGSRLPKHLNYKKVEIGDALEALGITEDWYRECNETLSLVVAYGVRGERCENARAVAACRDRAPKSRAGSSGPTELILLLRQVHEEYCERVRDGTGRSRDLSGE